MSKRSDFPRIAKDAYQTIDPRARRNRGCGKGLRFISDVLASATAECIEWPFYRTKNGYGQIGTHVGMSLAHRFVCERAHGAPQFEQAQAAHSCGNRACVNPRHIRWATQAENESDKFKHGTWFSRFGGAKLSEPIVIAIRRDADAGEAYRELSSKYETPVATIKKVVKRQTWKHV